MRGNVADALGERERVRAPAARGRWRSAGCTPRTTSRAALEFTSEIDVLGGGTIAVRYRCVIALRVAGEEIPEHECWHTDVYRYNGPAWRCTWSQATGSVDDPTSD